MIVTWTTVCVPTHMDLTTAAAVLGIVEMELTAQVG